MRKFICFLLLMALSLLNFAQNSKDKKKKTEDPFSVLFGLSFSKITGGDGNSYDGILVGPSFGFGLRGPKLSDQFGLAAEISYTGAGSKYTDDPYSGKVVLSYITVPVLLRFYAKSGFYAETGIQPAFLLSAKDKFGGGSYDFKDYVKSFDFGVPLGIGYEFKKKFGVGLRTTIGLSDLNKESGSTTKYHNLVFALRGSYRF